MAKKNKISARLRHAPVGVGGHLLPAVVVLLAHLPEERVPILVQGLHRATTLMNTQQNDRHVPQLDLGPDKIPAHDGPEKGPDGQQRNNRRPFWALIS